MTATIRSRDWAPIVVGVGVAVLAGFLLFAGHRTPRPVVPARVAVRAALANPDTARALAGSRWSRVSAAPLDRGLERVDFWRGGQRLVEVAVDGHRRVVQQQDFSRERVPYGDWLAYQPAVLVGLTIVFLLVTLVSPWRRLRNLDALAAASLVVPVVLFQHRYLNPSLLAAAPCLAYLGVRCAWRGLGPASEAGPSTPLLAVLGSRVDPAARIRWLRIALAVTALIFVMVGLSSPFPVDVTYAVLEGATLLIHGVLPYGHMPPGILHGDTYPVLSYGLYAPLAVLRPVRSLWDPVDGALVVAALAALAAAWAALRSVAGRRAHRSSEAEEAGLRAALAVLTFPAVLITASTGTTDMVLAATVGGALLLWLRPAAAAGTLAVAGWFKLAPFALVPVLLAALRGRRLAAALASIAAISAAAIALMVAAGGVHAPGEMIHAVAYQFERGSFQSIWSALGIERLQPLAQAGVLGLIATATVRVWLEPGLASDRRRMAALSAAVLIGTQLAANYWSFLYVVWAVPLLPVALLELGAARGSLAQLPWQPSTPVPALAA